MTKIHYLLNIQQELRKSSGRGQTMVSSGISKLPSELAESIIWSSEPTSEVIDVPSLPIFGISHLGCRDPDIVELRYFLPVAQEWNALIVCQKGRHYILGEFEGRKFQSPLIRDLCFFLPSGSKGKFSLPSESHFFCLMVKSSYLKLVLGEQATSLSPILGKKMISLSQVLSMIQDELRKQKNSSSILLDGLVRAATGQLISRNDQGTNNQENRIYIPRSKLERVFKFVDDNLQEKITLEDMSHQAGLSTNHFLRVFRLQTGFTPYQYVKQKRIEMAQRLLEEGKMPLAELALECGFANQAHFTAAFSGQLGISPGRYRKTINKIDDNSVDHATESELMDP